MNDENWLKQGSESLFPDLLWNRPENKRQAGKLLIVGGQAQSFLAPSIAFTTAAKAGIGVTKVLLPDSTQKLIGKQFAEAEFGPSTASGSFSREALARLIDMAKWADGVLLAGDLGKNSETAIMLEHFVEKYDGQLTLANDSLDYFMEIPERILDRQQTTIVTEIGHLQKLLAGRVLIKHSMSLVQLVEVLSTAELSAQIITEHQEHFVLTVGGRVSTTASKGSDLASVATYCGVWWLQQPSKPFEALTSAIYQATK